jgi:hypothetical protein
MGATKNLPPLRRAAALYVADRLFVTADDMGWPEVSDKESDLRSGFARLGADFYFYDPCGCYGYSGNRQLGPMARESV